jgi:hypothetical protein
MGKGVSISSRLLQAQRATGISTGTTKGAKTVAGRARRRKHLPLCPAKAHARVEKAVSREDPGMPKEAKPNLKA